MVTPGVVGVNLLAGPVMARTVGAAGMATGVVVVGVGGVEPLFAQRMRKRPLQPGSTLHTGQASERPLFDAMVERQDVER